MSHSLLFWLFPLCQNWWFCSLYLHQGPDVSTSLFARGKKTRVMIPVKSVEGCLLSIKAETSRNRTFLSEMFFFSIHLVCHRGNDPCVLTHRLNIKALTGMCCCYTYSATCGSKVEKPPPLCSWCRNENVPFLSPEFWSFVSKTKLRF